MNIFLISMIKDSLSETDFSKFRIDNAIFSAVGTWVDDGSQCDVCGWHGQDLGGPLQVEWEPSAQDIGDFSWESPFGYVFIITKPVLDFFKKQKFSFDQYEVEYMPLERKTRKRFTVSFPYQGPKQYWIEANKFIELDMKKSGVKIESECDVCHRIDHTFKWRDIIIPKKNIKNIHFFRISTNDISSATFVTEKAKKLIQEAGFSNIAFSKAGEIV